eukprot:IDg3853t1
MASFHGDIKMHYESWWAFSVRTRNVLLIVHGLTANTSNNGRPAALAAIRRYIKDVAEANGHPLPVRMRRTDRKVSDSAGRTVLIIVLPPSHTKRSLYHSLMKLQTIERNTSTSRERLELLIEAHNVPRNISAQN